ncbi:MAG TPA: nucleotidyltransferase family protein [Actinocatenispora sp.]
MTDARPDVPRADELRAVVTADPWLMSVLTAVRAARLPDAWVGAGVLRDLVWATRYGHGFDPAALRDVDVAYHEPGDVTRDGDARATTLLARLRPDVPWEATNQAAVHLWYAEFFDTDRPAPLPSTAAGVATWPETATAVAVRLGDAGGIEVCAPCGLDDLLDGVWRRNPARVTPAESRRRLARQRGRWPGARIAESDGQGVAGDAASGA